VDVLYYATPLTIHSPYVAGRLPSFYHFSVLHMLYYSRLKMTQLQAEFISVI
jgi:hypothetical protein